MTELVSIMFSRYGQHLKQTWQVSAGDAIAIPSQQQDFAFDEPISGL
ncbi:MAG: hypothetical protein SAQ54_20915 [Oscillatoria sp. PMC 1050.18]|nr:hypothetical protein [Oscillatoria sp. PMC 1050.18]